MSSIESVLNLFDIVPKDISLYEQAFTHASYTNEHPSCENYDRLEFLGDSILDMVIADMVFNKFPDYKSGNLSKIRSVLVGGSSLTRLSEEIYHLDLLVRYSVGEKNNTRFHHHINEDVFEAFIAAIYLDQGYNKVKEVLYTIFYPLLDEVDKDLDLYDPKTTLQEAVATNIDYEVVKKENLNSEDVSYTVEARLNGMTLGVGTGHNIQEAQKLAAKDALLKKVGK